jgi:oxygen-independent coproporphyrinogen III oxidase
MKALVATEDLAPLLSKYDVYGPRYTSYPTALQFNESFTDADYKQHAQSSNEMPVPKPLSVYIHIPFCKSLCYYCGCNKIVTHKQQLATDYLDYLYREIEMHGQHFADDRLLQQIHFGGGTPTFLSPQLLREVMEVLAQSFHLGLPDSLEIGIEVDPRTVTPEEMTELVTMGFNRISIGVQDFDPDVQKAINREQSKEQVEAVIQSARDNKVNSISMDIIYGLPKQTQDSFSNTLDEVISIRPDRIALYNYAHMPQRIPAQRLIHADDLPSTEEKLAIFTDSIRRLTEAGYIYIGMDHFALPTDSLAKALENGGLQRNFQGYSTHAECDVIGIGVSAISRINDGFSQNVTEVSKYKAAVGKGQLPIKRGVNLTEDDRIRADLIQQIMCDGVVDYSDFGQGHDIFFHRYFNDELGSLNDLAADGLIDLSDKGFSVTPKGRIFLRNIAMKFDAYFNQTSLQNTEQPRYSKTL